MKGTDIGILLFSLLKDIEGIDNRVYPVVAEDGSEKPFIVYARNSLTCLYTKDGIEEDTVNTGIDIVSSDYTQSVEIADRVRDILDNYQSADVYCVNLTGSSELYDDATGFVQHLDYNFNVVIK